jgi:hypothetical protein
VALEVQVELPTLVELETAVHLVLSAEAEWF